MPANIEAGGAGRPGGDAQSDDGALPARCPRSACEVPPACDPQPAPIRAFFVHNLGCKLNRVESDTISAALLSAGATAVTLDEARVVVVNSCTVTGEADAKTRKAIRQALAAAGQPWVVVTGCAVALERERYRRLGQRVIIEPDRHLAAERAWEVLGCGLKPLSQQAPCSGDLQVASEQMQATGVPGAHPLPIGSFARKQSTGLFSLQVAATGNLGLTSPPTAAGNLGLTSSPTAQRVGAGFPTRMGIKIQDGCDCRCTFCIVNRARGASRSEPLDALRAQVRAAAEAGVREIVLTGVNIGLYQDSGLGLEHLLADLLATSDLPRFRLSSLEPQHASDELLNLMAASGSRICAHLHLPLQSGADTTLTGMGRLYDTAFYQERVARARALMPRLGLTTDVICGFPGESEAAHQQSLDFCRRMAFAKMHVFRFSRRPSTPAAEYADQLAAPTIAERAHEMRTLANELASADAASRVGTIEPVLIESRGWGRAESYHRVRVPATCETGSLETMRFVSCRDTLIQAEKLSMS